MKHAPRICSGFTLVEVALAATILLMGFAGMAESLMIGSDFLDTARKETIAAQIMQSEIEYWRQQPWTTVTGTSGLTNVAIADAKYLVNYPEFASSNLATLAGTSFKFSRMVSYVPNRYNQILQVTMTVQWTSLFGQWNNITNTKQLHSRSCNAYIGQYGLNVSYQQQ